VWDTVCGESKAGSAAALRRGRAKSQQGFMCDRCVKRSGTSPYVFRTKVDKSVHNGDNFMRQGVSFLHLSVEY
jgi:hypothetical protein